MVIAEKLRRPSALAAASVLLLASLVPLLSQKTASAYTLLGPRQVRMSSSEAGGTNVTYKVKFQISSHASDLGGVVVAFCSGSPIIGDTTCDHPAGFDLDGAAVANLSDGTADEGDATVDLTGFTGATADLNSGAETEHNTLTLSNASAVSEANIDSGDFISFEITGVDNPSATGTFYARILTYATQAAAQGYSLANNEAVGPVVDAGGVALSTAAQITVTSKVQERLTFCVYTDANCGLGGTQVTLGDTNGVLDPGVQYTDNSTKFDLTSNAVGNVSVRMKGDTLKRTPGCPDGTGQGCSIDPIGETHQAGTTNTEQFGMRLIGGGGTLVPVDPYDDAVEYAFDDDAVDGTNSTYGSEIATMAAGASETATIEFVGNITNTTEAGIYTTTLTFIATGTY